MFRNIILVSILVASAAAFRPVSPMSRQSLAKVSMSAEFLPGALAPLGYFDPLGFCKDKTVGEVKVSHVVTAASKHFQTVFWADPDN